MSYENEILLLLRKMTAEEKVAQLDMIRGCEYIDRKHPVEANAVPDEASFDENALKRKMNGHSIGFVHDSYSSPKKANELQKIIVETQRLHIPAIFTGEGLHGIAYPGASIFPTPLSLAASFDRELVHEVGHCIGAETRSLGIHNIFAPNLDMGREPRWGRTEETFGEDTYLSSQMAYAIVTGEQGDSLNGNASIVSEVKHYCGHGVPEGGLNCAPTRAGVREMETEYLPVFESAVKNAGAWAVMASYNCVDGEVMIASDHYLNEILRRRYGLRGFVRADFGAVRRIRLLHHLTDCDKDSIEMAFNNGLDVQGFDYPNEIWQNNLLELLREGRITEQRLDEAVGRVLRVKFELGLFDHPYTDEKRYATVVRGERSMQTNRKAAEEGLVLLKNDGLLPFRKSVKSVAVIGPGANEQRVGGYSSKPYGYKVHTVAEEVSKLLPDAVVNSIEGCGISEFRFMPLPKKWFPNGVRMTFFETPDMKSAPVGESIGNQLYFNWCVTKPHASLPMNNYAVRFEGEFTVDTVSAQLCRIKGAKLGFKTVDSVRVWIDGQLVIDSVGAQKQSLPSCDFEFADGRTHRFIAEWICDMSGNEFALGICLKDNESFDKAVEAALQAEAVIVVVGDDTSISGECRDRCELKLFGRQSELVQAVAKTGKPFALVLENGRPADISLESELAKAILVAWYSGEFGARAIVRALFGEISPSGRLPISFPRGVGYLPDYYSRLPGKNTHYIEGKPDALYGFGHGLTYTKFDYSNLSLISGKERYSLNVNFDLKNVGTYQAAAVPQVYVRDECSSVVTPMLLLKAFDRIVLEPGETKHVSLALDEKAFQLLNLRREWVVETGNFEINVGESSNDIRLKGRAYADDSGIVIPLYQ